MSDDNRLIPDSDVDQPRKPGGPSLALIYSLIVLAMLAAVAFAVLIVLPYYHRR